MLCVIIDFVSAILSIIGIDFDLAGLFGCDDTEE